VSPVCLGVVHCLDAAIVVEMETPGRRYLALFYGPVAVSVHLCYAILPLCRYGKTVSKTKLVDCEYHKLDLLTRRKTRLTVQDVYREGAPGCPGAVEYH
jgi:hypothetical protein